jgi:predicted dehydrogenase
MPKVKKVSVNRMTQKIRLLILGTGGMARAHAGAFKEDPRCELVATCDVVPGRAAEFAKTFGISNHFEDLDKAIAWGAFDAVANVTPDSIHHPTTMRLLAAKKHVLCEKPLAENYALAKEMADAADKAGVINMVNLTYRNVAAIHVARRMAMDGTLGNIRHVEASYRQSWLVGNHWGDWKTLPMWLWRLSQKHGSKGVLGDVGIHILDFASFGMNAMPVSIQSRLKTFHKAEGDKIGEYPLDANDSAVMTVEFSNGAIGVIQTSRFMTGHDNELHLRIHGDKGAVEVRHFEGWTELRVCVGDNVNRMAWHHVKPEPVDTNYRRFINAIVSGEKAEPDFRHGANLQRTLDLCFEHDGKGVVAV